MPGRPVVARQPMRLTDRDQPAADRAARVRGRERREVGGDRLRRRGQRLPALRPAPVREMRPVGPVGAPRRRRQRQLRVAARGLDRRLPGRRQRRGVRDQGPGRRGRHGIRRLGWHAGSFPRDIVAGQGAIAAHAIMGDYRVCCPGQKATVRPPQRGCRAPEVIRNLRQAQAFSPLKVPWIARERLLIGDRGALVPHRPAPFDRASLRPILGRGRRRRRCPALVQGHGGRCWCECRLPIG